METIGERLKYERLSLGITQLEMASAGGCKRQAQIRYESGERSPDGNYFAGIAAAGADVQYILTGIRSAAVTPRQQALLDNYLHTSEEGKTIIEATASAAAQPTPAKKRA